MTLKDLDFRAVFKLLRQSSDANARWLLFAAFLSMVVTTAAAALGPLALKYAVDGLSHAGIVPVALVGLLGGYLLSLWITRVTGELRGYLYSCAELRIFRQVQRRALDHVLSLPLEYHLTRKSGATTQTIEDGCMGLRSILMSGIMAFIPEIAEILVTSTVIFFVLDGTFVAIFLASIVVYAAVFYWGAKRFFSTIGASLESRNETNAMLSENLVNYEPLKIFGSEPAAAATFSAALSRGTTRWHAFFRARFFNGVSIGTVSAVACSVSLIVAADRVLAGSLTIGDFVLLNTYILQMTRPVESLGIASRELGQGVGFLSSLLALFREKPERDDGVLEPAAGAPPANVRFENVGFAYHSERPILKDISFSIPAGTVTAVVGPSGAGKSSLVRLLMRLYDNNTGRISLDGEDISDYKIAALRKSIAVVPQDTILLNDTVANNVTFGGQHSRDELTEALSVAHLRTLVDSLPNGDQTVVGDRGLKLSGGERQRVAIARAVLKKPRLFVFDEATSSLDTRTERAIHERLSEVSRGVTTLVIAHRLSTVVHADQILVLKDGEIVERGRHAALLDEDGVYASLWRAQHAGPKSEVPAAAMLPECVA